MMRMAVPYYGRLLRTGHRLERVYFRVEVDSPEAEECSWSLQVWDPLKAGLCGWLEKQGVSGLVCRDSYPQLEPELVERGIKMHWGQDDVFEMIVARCHFAVS
jgi:hypothetical protein